MIVFCELDTEIKLLYKISNNKRLMNKERNYHPQKPQLNKHPFILNQTS